MNRIICLIIFTLSFWQIAKGQTTTTVKNSPDIFQVISTNSTDQGKVTIQQDDKVKLLVTKYIEFRRKENKIPGYRIRIFSNSGQSARTKAYSEKSRFTELYPDIVTYVEYETPNFKVYVGDFRNKPDAFRTYKQISKEFKNAFVVPTKINLPKL
jgi:hypothetical protein